MYSTSNNGVRYANGDLVLDIATNERCRVALHDNDNDRLVVDVIDCVMPFPKRLPVEQVRPLSQKEIDEVQHCNAIQEMLRD